MKLKGTIIKLFIRFTHTTFLIILIIQLLLKILINRFKIFIIIIVHSLFYQYSFLYTFSKFQL